MATLLNRTLKLANMRRAWNEVAANDGMAGVDNISIRAWRRNWEERLVNLIADVRANRYKPTRLRKRQIPKANRRGRRTLRIPTVTDRVLQRAVLQQLQPLYEPLFFDCSFGYRPGRGIDDAVREINRLRRRGEVWVLDADIDNFFNSVDHALLNDFLTQDLPDDSLMRLIDLWHTVDCLTPECDKGIPMGSPLSPLLANVYLHRMDEQIMGLGYSLVRYADDFIVLADSGESLFACYEAVGKILAGLKLDYEPNKTRLTNFEEGFDFLGVHFEETWYWYTWGDKRVEVHDESAGWLLKPYLPDYE